MNEMTLKRLQAYCTATENMMKEQGQSKKAASEGKHPVKDGLGIGGGCLR